VTERDVLALSTRIIDGAGSLGEHPVQMGFEVHLGELAPDLAFVEAFGNVVALRGDGELALVDASGPLHARAVHEAVRRWSDLPLRTAVYTHGHVDHVAAIGSFEAEDRGPLDVVAHEAVTARFDRYERTHGYNAVINQRQFQLPSPMFPRGHRRPDRTYRDHLEVTTAGRTLELHHDRGETDDGTWVWLADQRVLCTGDLFIWASPNCGNPQKAQRYCDEWAAALRKMADLGAELLLPGHGLPIEGADRIRGVLGDTARWLESIFDQTLELMNAGARLDEIVQVVRPPADLDDRPWLQPVYDEPEFVVRGIWRLYGGWYDGNPAHLKPAPDAVLAAEVARLAGGAEVLAQRALDLSAEGEHRLAGHLIEMATQAAPSDGEVRRARATVFGARAAAERSTMAKGVFAWAARPDDSPG